MRITWLFLLSGLLTLLPLTGQTSLQEIRERPELSGGVYLAYPEGEIKAQTPPPRGYEPFYISHFGRHGSRYLINDSDYKGILDKFEEAYGQNALTPLGIDVYNRLLLVWDEAEGHGGDLSPLGVRQLRGIGERMYRSYPAVFSDSVEISARSTMVVRCVLSMDALCERLKELNPTLQITREASNKYMSYLNYHTAEAVEFRSSDLWREEYHKFEESLIKPDRLIKSLFADDLFILRRVSPAKVMRQLFAVAIGMQNIETEVTLFDLFEPEEMFDLWQIRNYRWYVEYASSSQNNGIMMGNPKPVLKNIIESADKVITSQGRGATLRFAHDGNLVPLTMLLHLENCYTSVEWPADAYRVWSDFRVSPMAGNIQMIFFRKRGSDDVLVKFLLHEKETLVPPIKSDQLPYYHWKDVRDYYQSLLDSPPYAEYK